MCQWSPKSEGGFAFIITRPSRGGWLGQGSAGSGQWTLLILLCGWKPWGRSGDCPFPRKDLIASRRRKMEAQVSHPSGVSRAVVMVSVTVSGVSEPSKQCDTWSRGGTFYFLNLHDYVEKENCKFGGELYGICD